MRVPVTVALFVALVVSATGALAQSSERLQRPFPESQMGADGRLVVSMDSTMGNLAVDYYARIGQMMLGHGPNPHSFADAYRPTICGRQGTGGFVADRLGQVRRDFSPERRAALRSKEPAALADLSIEVIAHFDGVSADAIRADEAIGPGVYSDAIRGLGFALDICNFYGRRP